MKIIVTSIGTRGDMEPFLAAGEILKEKGHEVICLFPEQFRSLAQDSGLKFESLGKGFINMLDSTAGKIAMGGGRFGFSKMKAYATLISVQKKVNKEMIQLSEQVIEKETPDKIIHNGKAIYPVIWSLSNKGKTIWISPVPYMHYVKDHSHLAFNKNFGPFCNKLSYKLANYGLIKTIMNSVKWLKKNNNIKQRQIQNALFTNKAIYTISPTLFSRPEYWDENLMVLGYHERNKASNWEPDKELKQFLQKHPKLLLVTFGSMINMDPPAKTRILLDTLSKNNIPAIINTASGGLVKPIDYNPELFHFVSRIPYDWVFPKIYGVIHHGGSGTTHMAIKNGCPSLIIPHIIDQYLWNKIIHRKGLGPLGIDVSKITQDKLESKILDLFQNESYKVQANKLANNMKQEDLRMKLYQELIS